MEMSKENRDTVISSLYSRCFGGEISVEQREALIQKAKTMCANFEAAKARAAQVKVEKAVEAPAKKVEAPVVRERVSRPTVQKESVPPSERFNLFKDAAYAKCADGKFNLEFREELLKKARERFFNQSK